MFSRLSWLSVAGALALSLAACAPAAPPSPTTPPKPTEAPKPAAKPTEAPAAKPTEAPAAKPTEKPAAKPTEAPKPAAKPTEAPAAKPAFDEKSVADFYRGKTIRIVVGFAPGGGFDTLARLVAKHLPKYMPGSPNAIVENKPGAGSMLAANEVYKTAEKDGTVIAHFNEQMVLLQAIGQQGVEFDARKYNWLGSLIESPSACAIRTDMGVTSIQEVIGGKQVIIGADAPGSTTHDVPAVLNAAVGTNFKIVPGYAGTSQQRLAVERKEVDGACFTWESLRSTARAWFEQNPPAARVLVIMGDKTPDHPWLKGVPAAETLAKTAEARQLLQAVNLPSTMSKPYAVAPEVPRDRVEALRVAFAKVAQDKDFLAEAEKAQIEITFNSAAALEGKVKQILDMPSPVIEKLKTILK